MFLRTFLQSKSRGHNPPLRHGRAV